MPVEKLLRWTGEQLDSGRRAGECGGEYQVGSSAEVDKVGTSTDCLPLEGSGERSLETQELDFLSDISKCFSKPTFLDITMASPLLRPVLNDE